MRGEFAKPTAEEVAAYVRDKGYTFDPEQFWHFYESKGWRVGSHVMKSWQSACVVWQKKECRDARREAERTAHIDAKMDEREAERRRLADSRREPDPEEARRANIDCGLKLIGDRLDKLVAHGRSKGWRLEPPWWTKDPSKNTAYFIGQLKVYAGKRDALLREARQGAESKLRRPPEEGISPERSEPRKRPLGGCAA